MSRTLLLLTAALSVILVVATSCGGSDDESSSGGVVASGGVPFDLAFIDAMVPHHRSAIDMARAAQERGLTQPDLQTIAREIITSQQREINQMLEWRETWFGSRALGPVDATTLGVPESELGMGHGGADEITSAMDVDATFAQMMIPHHEGAIAMARAAEERGQHEEIKDLAAAIIEAQAREIEIMQKHATGAHHGG